MSKRFRECSLDQVFLLPPSLQDWLPEDHLARFIAEMTDELDLSEIYASYERRDGRGMAAYHPLLLTRLLLYGYCIGEVSSRRIEQATYDQLAFRYLAADQHPDHDTIASFRQQQLESLGKLFVQALRLCQKAGLVKLGHVAIDGTKIRAAASPAHSLKHAQLSEREQYWKSTIQGLLEQASARDEEEDRRWGKGQSERALPAELAQAQTRLQRLQQAKWELEEEARKQQSEAAAAYTPGKPGRPSKNAAPCAAGEAQMRAKQKKQWHRAKKNAEAPTRHYNLTDPDSRMMRDNGLKCIVQAYNAQLAVDGQTQIIVAADLTQEVIDRGQFLPMVEKTIHMVDKRPETVTADAGYWNTESLCHPQLQQMQVLVSPDGVKSIPGKRAQGVPQNEIAQAMRSALGEESKRAIYRLRKAIIEPVFAQIKEHRFFRRFSVRGLGRVKAEWQLVCLTHNLLKLFRQSWCPKLAC